MQGPTATRSTRTREASTEAWTAAGAGSTSARDSPTGSSWKLPSTRADESSTPARKAASSTSASAGEWAKKRQTRSASGFAIGVPRFELGTSPTRTERATRLRHTPRREQVSDLRRLANAAYEQWRAPQDEREREANEEDRGRLRERREQRPQRVAERDESPAAEEVQARHTRE